MFTIRYIPPIQEKFYVIYKFCEQHYVLAQNLNNYPNSTQTFKISAISCLIKNSLLLSVFQSTIQLPQP